MDDRKQHGVVASSHEYASYDQVTKPAYRLAEQDAGDGASNGGFNEAFDDDFVIRTCDLGRALYGDERDRRAFADELGAAMQEIGFAILEGHGVDPQLFAEAAAWVEDFYTSVPLADKLRFRAARHGSVSEGYFPIQETSAIHPDLVEGWVFGRRAFDLDGDAGFDPAQLWPRVEFEPRFRRLVQAELPLFRPIMAGILTYLGCDPHMYDDRLERAKLGLRLNYYPPLRGDADHGRAGRLLGHEDIDLFTLLPAPAIEGLQVLSRGGKWVRLHAPPGTIVLNTGDYLQRLSNDLLPSTTHRVSRPRDPELARRARVSFPLAAYLPEHDVLRVLPGLANPRYEPIKVITFHTRTTAKFYGDDYAVEVPVDS
ncbi:MAG TPA: 2OG-Fe(II) oxygenase family protein [Kofleriaceae bacterium]